jgi:predicted lipid-binding transport protein (Tim44 family)
MDDIRQFTAPELFAEIKMQYRRARRKTPQRPTCSSSTPILLEVATEGTNHVASVRFHGQIREDNAAPEAFVEIWHLAKPIDGSRGWTIAGIQQA